MYKAFVVDDEKPSRDELIYLLNQVEDITVIGEAGSGEDALDEIIQKRPDIVFLDIELHDMNGLELAEQILSVYNPHIVFATAYDAYAIKAFELQALDYLLKPFSAQRLSATINRLRQMSEPDEKQLAKILDLLEKKQHKESSKIPINRDGKILLLARDKIVFVETQERNCVIHSEAGEFHVPGSIGDWEVKLQGYPFFRVHRSFIINLDKVKEVIPWFQNTYQVVMDGYEDMPLPVGRNKIALLKELLNL
ncbi:MAG TPA: response regulator transcription factor [Clostridia bacterium]|nr:response regulator transcription factor [Clostridia bacterium]